MQVSSSQTVGREHVEGLTGIYRRRTKTGEVRYEIAYLDSTGRQRWKTTGTLREAKALRADLVSRVNRGEAVASSRATLREYAAEWLAGQSRLRPRTLGVSEGPLRLHLLPRLGRRRLADVSTDDVARLVADLEAEGLAAWTVRGVLTVLSRVLGSAERRGLVSANPAKRLERGERPKIERREFPSLDREARSDA